MLEKGINMTKKMAMYKERINSNLISYEDSKNLIINTSATQELQNLERFEKEKKISVEDLEDDEQYFAWLKREHEKSLEPLHRKIFRLLRKK